MIVVTIEESAKGRSGFLIGDEVRINSGAAAEKWAERQRKSSMVKKASFEELTRRTRRWTPSS